MEAAHANRNPGRTKPPRQIHRARILIRLHANQRHQRFAAAQFADQPIDPHPRVGLIDRSNLDIDVRAQRLPLLAIERKAVKHGQRIRRHGGPEPLNHVAVVIVVRRLDQYQAQTFHHFT